MQTWDAVRSRRNVRVFAERPLAPDDLDRILEAGRRAPSARNGQPWDFVVVTRREVLGRLAGVWRGAGHVAGAAAAVGLVAAVPPDERSVRTLYYDLGQATYALALAAADLGIGSGHASVEDQDLAREVLGLPADRSLTYLLSLGYPADRPLTVLQRPDRRPFDEVVHRERW